MYTYSHTDYTFQFELPGHIGRLPKVIGESSGRALSADQWLTLALAVGPIAVSNTLLFIWCTT